MINMHRNIPSFPKKFNKINSSLIVVGGGRWTTIIIKELIKNFKNIDEIFVVTKNNKILENFNLYEQKKIKHHLDFKFTDVRRFEYAIIANKNKDHFSVSKKLLDKKINILVEKPLVEKINQYRYLKKLSKIKKCKIYISMPFYFSYYFYFFKKKYLNNLKYTISFYWNDQVNEIRDGNLKTHDFSINYLEDTIYHFYGILISLFGNKKIIFQKSINKRNYGFLKIKYGKNTIFFHCSRMKKNSRVRLISFLYKKKKYQIDYSKDNDIKIQKNGIRKKLNFKFCQKTLKFQLFSFLDHKNFQSKFLINEINKLDEFFKLIAKIKK